MGRPMFGIKLRANPIAQGYRQLARLPPKMRVATAHMSGRARDLQAGLTNQGPLSTPTRACAVSPIRGARLESPGCTYGRNRAIVDPASTFTSGSSMRYAH